MDSQQNFLNHLPNKIQFLRDRNHRGITNKICLIKLQFKTRSEKDRAKGSSRDNDDRSDKIDLIHKTSKENLFKVETDNTVDQKTSNEFSDDNFIDFNLVSTVTNVSNLSSLKNNNSNACDITNVNEEKSLEAVLIDSVPISAPDSNESIISTL